MGILKKLFGRGREKNKIDDQERDIIYEESVVEGEEYLKELGVFDEEPLDEERIGLEEIYIKSISLYGLDDVPAIANELEEGNILVLNVSPLVHKGDSATNELKRTVDRLRGLCRSLRGDIAQLGDNYIIVTPSFVRIWRRKKPKEAV
ncbi:MAG: cell division protein SepF [Candidatus Hodarchaeota archaeon]